MEKEYSIVWIYVITGLVSLVIAQFLVHWSRLSAAARLKLETQRLQEGGAVKPISDESLTQAVFEEIAPLVDSRQHRSDISKKVAGIFNKELEKQVNATAQELTRKAWASGAQPWLSGVQLRADLAGQARCSRHTASSCNMQGIPRRRSRIAWPMMRLARVG